jgi:hypothetical protein
MSTAVSPVSPANRLEKQPGSSRSLEAATSISPHQCPNFLSRTPSSCQRPTNLSKELHANFSGTAEVFATYDLGSYGEQRDPAG